MKKSILFLVIFFLLATAVVVKGKPASEDQFQVLFEKLALIESKIDALTQCACNCPAEEQICDDNIDNDCDGYVDCSDSDCTSDPYCQQTTCIPYEVQYCDTGEPGICSDGQQTCDESGDFWGPCIRDVEPSTEVCNGIDDDCDGQVDQGGNLCSNVAPFCDNESLCQGHSEQGMCVEGLCTTIPIADDSACSSSVEANTCGYYLSVYCNGQIDQTPPNCPTSCITDTDCDPEAYCDSTCQPDLVGGSSCSRDNQCLSGICFDGTCEF